MPSPAAADLPPLADEDVIRNGVHLQARQHASSLGRCRPTILIGTAAFANAREPLAQAFKAAGAPDADAFAVIVNHFKSKGSGHADDAAPARAPPTPTASAQANALVDVRQRVPAARGVDAGLPGR